MEHHIDWVGIVKSVESISRISRKTVFFLQKEHYTFFWFQNLDFEFSNLYQKRQDQNQSLVFHWLTLYFTAVHSSALHCTLGPWRPPGMFSSPVYYGLFGLGAERTSHNEGEHNTALWMTIPDNFRYQISFSFFLASNVLQTVPFQRHIVKFLLTVVFPPLVMNLIKTSENCTIRLQFTWWWKQLWNWHHVRTVSSH